MPDHMLKPITPLGGDAARSDRFEGLTVSEKTDLALASLAARLGREDEVAKLANGELGLTLPAPGKLAHAAPWAAFWTSPSQWMVEAPFQSHEDIAGLLKAGFGDTASITEQTDAWARFDLVGPRTADVFERLCALDARRMQSGSANRTMIEHLGCFVLCREAALAFSVLGPRSAARSLHHALLTAAKSVI